MSSESGGAPSGAEPDASTQDLRRGIEDTRAHMSETLHEIERRLEPGHLKEKVVEELQGVEEKVKAAVREQLHDAKVTLKAELSEAKDTVKQELIEAKDSVKKEIGEAIDRTKDAVHAATIGRVQTMARRAGETVQDTGESIVGTIRANPIPAAIAGFGLVWLFMNRNSARDVDYGEGWRGPGRGRGRKRNGGGDGYRYGNGYANGDGEGRSQGEEAGVGRRAVQAAGRAAGAVQHGVGDMAHHASDAVTGAARGAADAAGHLASDASDMASDIAHKASDAAGRFAHRAGEMGGGVADRARSGARRAEHAFVDTLHSNPLAIGAGVLAIGAVVGLALPGTRREDALMGEVRDKLVDRGQQAAHEALETVHDLTEKTADKAKEALENGEAAG